MIQLNNYCTLESLYYDLSKADGFKNMGNNVSLHQLAYSFTVIGWITITEQQGYSCQGQQAQ
jgi:hypothetical protein